MKKSSVEIIVGLFCILGLICVAYLTIKLGKMELFGDNNYQVKALFETASGLRKGSVVEMAGVSVGRVDSINLQLEQGKAKALVALTIRQDVQLDTDVIASIRRSGLVGDMYIKLSPGGGDEILKAGDKITETESAIDLEELIGKYIFGNVDKK